MSKQKAKSKFISLMHQHYQQFHIKGGTSGTEHSSLLQLRLLTFFLLLSLGEEILLAGDLHCFLSISLSGVSVPLPRLGRLRAVCNVSHVQQGYKYHICVCAHTNSKEHSPSWEANSSSASQKIPHILLNPKAHYHVHKILPLASILSQITLVHTFPSYFLKINFNITLPATPKCSKSSLSFKFPHQKPICISLLPHVFHMSNPSHTLDSITQIIFGVRVKIMKLLIMHFSPVLCYFPPLTSKYLPQHPILKHHMPVLYI